MHGETTQLVQRPGASMFAYVPLTEVKNEPSFPLQKEMNEIWARTSTATTHTFHPSHTFARALPKGHA